VTTLIDGEDGVRKAIIERIRAKDLEINAVKAEQTQYRASLDQVRSKEEKAGADIPKMQEERNACYEIIKAKREEIRRLRSEFKTTEDEYWVGGCRFKRFKSRVSHAALTLSHALFIPYKLKSVDP
jgi:uncharacterized coiled-coil DUF342 family protein